MRISDWSSDVCSSDLEELRAQHEQWRRAAHADTRWAHFVNIALGCWILVQPVIVEVQEPALFWSEIVLGAALILFATLSLSWRMAWARWASAVVAAGIMAVPFLFWTTNPAAFLSDTLRSEEHTSELQSLMR